MGEVDREGKFRLEASDDEEIKSIEYCSGDEMKKFRKSLYCYETFQEVIEVRNVKNM